MEAYNKDLADTRGENEESLRKNKIDEHEGNFVPGGREEYYDSEDGEYYDSEDGEYYDSEDGEYYDSEDDEDGEYYEEQYTEPEDEQWRDFKVPTVMSESDIGVMPLLLNTVRQLGDLCSVGDLYWRRIVYKPYWRLYCEILHRGRYVRCFQRGKEHVDGEGSKWAFNEIFVISHTAYCSDMTPDNFHMFEGAVSFKALTTATKPQTAGEFLIFWAEGNHSYIWSPISGVWSLERCSSYLNGEGVFLIDESKVFRADLLESPPLEAESKDLNTGFNGLFDDSFSYFAKQFVERQFGSKLGNYSRVSAIKAPEAIAPLKDGSFLYIYRRALALVGESMKRFIRYDAFDSELAEDHKWRVEIINPSAIYASANVRWDGAMARTFLLVRNHNFEIAFELLPDDISQ